MHQATELLISTLKKAHAAQAAILVHASGKSDGLFPRRTAESQAVMDQCLRDGLLELERTESKGKTLLEWVRLTPRGWQFLQQATSPREIIQELLARLDVQEAGMAQWVAQIKDQVLHLANRLESYLLKQEEEWRGLKAQCLAALAKIQTTNASSVLTSHAFLPWQLDVLTLAEQHAQIGRPVCLLQDLFTTLQKAHADLTITSFHTGLLEMRDRGCIELLTTTQDISAMAEPEYLLLDGQHLHDALKRV